MQGYCLARRRKTISQPTNERSAEPNLFELCILRRRKTISQIPADKILMLILPKHIQLCNQTFAYLKEIHYLCNQIKFALFGLGCPRSEKGCHRQLFFITPLEILSCHTSCHPPDRYSFSKRRMPSSHHLDSTHDE